MSKLLVYGTLKRGFSNHNRIFSGYDIKITPAWTYGELYDLGYFPALTEGDHKVYGELVEFDDDKLLEELDRLEGFLQEDSKANFYDRIERSIHCENGELKAWVYVLNPNRCHRHTTQLIRSGIWG